MEIITTRIALFLSLILVAAPIASADGVSATRDRVSAAQQVDGAGRSISLSSLPDTAASNTAKAGADPPEEAKAGVDP